MRELIAPFGMVYRSKLDYDVWGKYIALGIGDSEENWELVSEEVIEEYLKNNNIKTYLE